MLHGTSVDSTMDAPSGAAASAAGGGAPPFPPRQLRLIAAARRQRRQHRGRAAPGAHLQRADWPAHRAVCRPSTNPEFDAVLADSMQEGARARVIACLEESKAEIAAAAAAGGDAAARECMARIFAGWKCFSTRNEAEPTPTQTPSSASPKS